MKRSHRYAREQGQALIEGLVGLSALLAVFVAVPVIGRYVDIGLTTTADSAHAAFLATRHAFSDAALARAVAIGSGPAPAARWRDRGGAPLIDKPVAVTQSRLVLPQAAQVGGTSARALRDGWQIEDSGIRTVHAVRQARDVTDAAEAPLGGSRREATLRWHRGTAVLAEAGHGMSPADVQRRVAAHPGAWQVAWRRSQAVAERVGRVAAAVDAGWQRPPIAQDWVQEWPDLVPRDRLRRSGP